MTENRHAFLSTLAVGDKVGVRSRYVFRLAVVARITPTGRFVLEDKRMFDRFGVEIGKFADADLVSVETVEQALAAASERKARKLAATALKDGVALAIYQHTNGFGEVSPFDREDKDALIALVEAL